MGKSSPIVHNFQESLKLSNEYTNASWWEEIYKKSFMDFDTMRSVRQDGWAQKGGIDRIIILKSGKILTVDEKVRKKDYGDILLERWSNQENQIAGWIQKSLACDYIAYAIIPTKTCYLLPFQQLRMIWIKNGREWIKKYKKIIAQNYNYKTESIAIPTNILMNELLNSMIINW